MPPMHGVAKYKRRNVSNNMRGRKVQIAMVNAMPSCTHLPPSFYCLPPLQTLYISLNLVTCKWQLAASRDLTTYKSS